MSETPPLPEESPREESPRRETRPEPTHEPGWAASLAAVLRQGGAPPPAGRLLLLVAAGCALYGFAAGFFQGGEQVLWSSLKAPLVVLCTLLLCIPSFVVFHLVVDGRGSAVALLRTAVAFAAVTALFLAALAPIGWLFSATSVSLSFVVSFHLVIWGVALAFGLRHLMGALADPAARGVSLLWSVLFWLVAAQLATYLGPMLVHEAGAARFPLDKGSFLERTVDVGHWDQRQRNR